METSFAFRNSVNRVFVRCVSRNMSVIISCAETGFIHNQCRVAQSSFHFVVLHRHYPTAHRLLRSLPSVFVGTVYALNV